MATIEVEVPPGVDAASAKRVLEEMIADQARTGRLVEALAREEAPPGPGALAQAGRIDRSWRAVQATYGLYTGDEVARLTGAPARSARSHVHNLRRRNGLLGVRRGGGLVYPGFQFTSKAASTVRAEWRDLTAPLLAAGWAEAEILLWFASPTGLLSGETPADNLDKNMDLVRAAVAQAAAGTPG